MECLNDSLRELKIAEGTRSAATDFFLICGFCCKLCPQGLRTWSAAKSMKFGSSRSRVFFDLQFLMQTVFTLSQDVDCSTIREIWIILQACCLFCFFGSRTEVCSHASNVKPKHSSLRRQSCEWHVVYCDYILDSRVCHEFSECVCPLSKFCGVCPRITDCTFCGTDCDAQVMFCALFVFCEPFFSIRIFMCRAQLRSVFYS